MCYCSKFISNLLHLEKYKVYIFIHKINDRIVFKMKTWYKLDLQTPRSMKLFSITKIVDKTNNAENLSSLAVVEVVLVQCDFAYNQYQQKFE